MTKDEYLGEFEHLVLLAIVRLDTEAYGVAIRRTIRKNAHRATTYGAVYATLRRLDHLGLVSSRLGDAEPVRGGRAKKYFTLTDTGLAALRASRRRLAEMAAGVETLVDSS